MRSKLILPVFVLLLFSAACNKNGGKSADYSLVGKWKLTEFYIDPGNGSGQWQPASVLPNPEFADFKPGGLFVNDVSFLTVYNRYKAISDSTLWLINTTHKDSIHVLYSVNLGTLTLRPPCFEGCGFKFTRLGTY